MRLVDVHKSYRRGVPVLRGVSMHCPPASVTAVLGGNGCGKSTLLAVLAGVCRPSGGRVLDRPEAVAYVPEKPAVTERMSAVEYLVHHGRIRGLRTPSARRRAKELVELLGLVGDPRAPIHTLSNGNAQKVALAQALLVPVGLLVADEPFAGRAAQGGVVVVAEHRDPAIAELARRRYLLREGVLSEVGTPTVTVVLRGRGRLDWPGAPAEHDGEISLSVAEPDSDDLLRAALTRGWSVRSVSRA